MAAEERWYFTKEQLANTPSRKCGMDADKELSNRQQAANFMQDLGQRIRVNQLCINTAIVYMHRFYMFHSFTKFHRNAISVCALFLAAKVEEQPRKLEFILKWAHTCLHHDAPPLDQNTEAFADQQQELVINENTMLQTLGFDVAIDHPHTHVVKCCQLVRASKDLAQTSYFMATNSLHLTTMSVLYRPTVVACVCIYLACKWACWEIPKSSEGKPWFNYVDRSVTKELLEELITDFMVILDRCPSRLKRKMLSCGGVNDKLPDEIMNLDKRPSGNSPTFPTNPQSDHPFDRERSSSMSSSSSGKVPSKSGGPLFDNGPTQVAPNPDKNGSMMGAMAAAMADDAKARAAKNAVAAGSANAGSAGRSSSSAAGSAGVSQRHSSLPPPTSPMLPQAVVAGNTSASASSTSSTVVPQPDMSHNSLANQGESPALSRRPKPDAGTRNMTPKEYRERKNRETEKIPPVTALPTVPTNQKPQQQPPPTSSHSSSSRMERADREREAAKGLALANNSSAKQGQQQPPQSSSAGGVPRPSSHHHHQQHHNRKTPEKQRHHQQQQQEAERHRSSGGGGPPSGHFQRGPQFPSVAVAESGPTHSLDGNHAGRPISRAVAPTRPAPPRPLLTPSPPLQDDDHDGLLDMPVSDTGDRADTLVNPLDGRAMVIPAIDSRLQPSSRSNHSAEAGKGSIVDHRRREEQQRAGDYLKVGAAGDQPSAKRPAPSSSKDRSTAKNFKSKAWPAAEPSPNPPAQPHHHHHPTNTSAVAPPVVQKNVMPNQVLPPTSHVTDGKSLIANPASLQHHHQPSSGGVRRPIATSGAGQPPHHQPVKGIMSLAEVQQRGAVTHPPTKVDPTAMLEDKMHPRAKLGRADVPFADAQKRSVVAAPVLLQQPQFVNVEPHAVRVERGASAHDPTKDAVVGMPSLMDAKLKMEHRHPALLEPIPSTLEEVRSVAAPAAMPHHDNKVEVVPTTVTQMKQDQPEVSTALQVVPIPAAISLAPVLRESRTKVSSAHVKDVRPTVAEPAPVAIAPPIKEVKSRSASQAPDNTDNVVKPRTSARREGKEAKARSGVPASATVLPSAVKTPSPLPVAPIAEIPVSVSQPNKVEPSVAVAPTPPPAPATTSSSKHERREAKHRHKDKDREKDRSSKERRKEGAAANKALLLQQQQAAASTPPPSIKLTIAKDRWQMGNSVDSSRMTPESGGMGLKLKIPREKLSSSNSRASSSKSQNSMSSSLVVSNSGGNGTGDGGSSHPPVPSLGLKIKITTGAMGSKVMSVESSKERVSESRKREREEPSPKVPAASQGAPDNNDERAAKVPKVTRAATRRNSETGSRTTPDNNPVRQVELRQSGPADVPPSSNTRSARGQEQGGPRHPGGGRGRPPYHGRGGGPGKQQQQQHGGYMGHPMQPFGGAPFNPPQMYQYPPLHPYGHPNVPNYFNHPPPPPQYYNQPPPFIGHHMGGPMPPHPHQGHRFQGHPPPGHQSSSIPPLPREPPPTNPPLPPE